MLLGIVGGNASSQPSYYLRLLANGTSYTTDGGSYFWICGEVEFYSGASITGTLLPTNSPSASSTRAAYPARMAAKAFDGAAVADLDQTWNSETSLGSPQWLQAIVTSTVLLPASWRIYTPSAASGYLPQSVVLQWSYNGSTFYNISTFSLANAIGWQSFNL